MMKVVILVMGLVLMITRLNPGNPVTWLMRIWGMVPAATTARAARTPATVLPQLS